MNNAWRGAAVWNEARLATPVCQPTDFHQLSLKAGQNFKNPLISIPPGERARGGTARGMSQGTSAAGARSSAPPGDVASISYDHEATCARLITVLCDRSHILKLSVTQPRKSCLSASHPLPQRMKNSNLQGWACLMNAICFCGTEDARGFGCCELDAAGFVNDSVVLAFRWI